MESQIAPLYSFNDMIESINTGINNQPIGMKTLFPFFFFLKKKVHDARIYYADVVFLEAKE